MRESSLRLPPDSSPAVRIAAQVVVASRLLLDRVAERIYDVEARRRRCGVVLARSGERIAQSSRVMKETGDRDRPPTHASLNLLNGSLKGRVDGMRYPRALQARRRRNSRDGK